MIDELIRSSMLMTGFLNPIAWFIISIFVVSVIFACVGHFIINRKFRAETKKGGG